VIGALATSLDQLSDSKMCTFSLARTLRCSDPVSTGAMNATAGQKPILVYCYVENTGLHPNGRHELRDGNWFPSFDIVPEAKAGVYSSTDTPEYRRRVKQLCSELKEDHLWVGWFALADTDDVLEVAKRKALEEAKRAGARE
jgi:hypothetical protein